MQQLTAQFEATKTEQNSLCFYSIRLGLKITAKVQRKPDTSLHGQATKV